MSELPSPSKCSSGVKVGILWRGGGWLRRRRRLQRGITIEACRPGKFYHRNKIAKQSKRCWNVRLASSMALALNGARFYCMLWVSV